MKLYFGNMVTTVTTIMIFSLVGFIGYSVWNHNDISYWGRRNLFLLIYGLIICCFAAARDGLDKTIQATVDGSCTPGIFPLVSIPTNDYCCSSSNTNRKITTNARNMVLCDVQWSNAESCGYGDCKNRIISNKSIVSRQKVPCKRTLLMLR